MTPAAMDGSSGRGRAYRALITMAALVVILAGLKAAGDVILPILFSVFLSILALPVVNGLKRVGVPTPLAIFVVVLAVALVLVSITGIVAGTVRSFTAKIPAYQEPLQQLWAETVLWLERLEAYGIPSDIQSVTDFFRPGDVMGVVTQTVNAVVAVLANVIVITLTMTFILFEANDLALKARLAFGEDANVAGPFEQAPENVQQYLLIKTIVSGFTGLSVGLWVYVLGLDFPVMWGLIAFMMNYIPSIGSILAAIPPILLAIVQLGWLSALGVAIGFIVVNVLLGNLIEPRLLGRSLGLSPLVVFLSLLFWAWMWGPAGMLLCVPMTVILKLVLESSEDTRWIAVFLGSSREAKAAS